MGLSDILSNPALIGMAMAGLSRDREAPMNAMKSLQMVEEINRRREEEARKQQAQQANTGLLQALMQAKAQEGDIMSQAMQDYGAIKGMSSTSQGFTPDQQTGTAVDYETGQSYQPTQIPNQNRSAAVQNFYNTLASRFKRPQIDFSQYQGASPEVMLAIMKDRFDNKPADQLMENIEKREKPIVMKEGDTLVDPITYLPVGAGANKKQKIADIKQKYFDNPNDPEFANLTPEQKKILGTYMEPDKEAASMRSFEEIYPQFKGKKGTPAYAAAWEKYKNLSDEKQRVGITVGVTSGTARAKAFKEEGYYAVTDNETGQRKYVKGYQLNNDQTGRYMPLSADVDLAEEKGAAKQRGGATTANVTAAYKMYMQEAPELIELRNSVYAKGALPSRLKSMESIQQWLGKESSDPDTALLQKKTKFLADSLMRVIGGTQGGEWAFKVAADILDPSFSPDAFSGIVMSHGVAMGRMAQARQNFGKPGTKVTDPEELLKPKQTTAKKITKQFYSPSTKKTKYLYSDGTEEIK